MVIRPSYTLGGKGAGFVHKKEDFDAALSRGLQASPTHEVLVEQAVLGWKEYELELLRDNNDNVIIICSIENFDPMYPYRRLDHRGSGHDFERPLLPVDAQPGDKNDARYR